MCGIGCLIEQVEAFDPELLNTHKDNEIDFSQETSDVNDARDKSHMAIEERIAAAISPRGPNGTNTHIISHEPYISISASLLALRGSQPVFQPVVDEFQRAALERRKAHPARVMVGLDIDGSELVAHGDPIYGGRAQIGQITSTTRSPILGKTIALARLDVSAAEPGATVEIGKLDGHQKRIQAKQVRFSHYDPEKARVRA